MIYKIEIDLKNPKIDKVSPVPRINGIEQNIISKEIVNQRSDPANKGNSSISFDLDIGHKNVVSNIKRTP